MSSHELLTRLLVEEFGVDPARIEPSATPTGLGLDSLSTAELVNELERELDIELTDEQASFETLGEAIAVLDEVRGLQG